MPSSIRNVTLDCSQAWPLAQFWSAVLDRPIHPDNEPSDDEVGILLAETGGEFILIEVPEPKTGKNRMHVCLEPDGPRDAEVDRILGLGATLVNDLRTPDGRGWAVLADPEGNEFCVLRSAEERAATS
jgi:predicted enzyme related to lactoylglutathione lyase